MTELSLAIIDGFKTAFTWIKTIFVGILGWFGIPKWLAILILIGICIWTIYKIFN